MSTLKINHIFWSIQGEGERSGLGAIFIRFAGCSLECPWCDTKEAWDKGKDLTVSQIIQKVMVLNDNIPTSCVVLTGGEPLEQQPGALFDLVKDLKENKFFLALETNGLYDYNLEIDWWTVSPKDQTDFKILPTLIPKVNEIKLVVNPKLTTIIIKNIRDQIPLKVPIYLQPDIQQKKGYQMTYDIFKLTQGQNLTNVKLGIQLHKIYNID